MAVCTQLSMSISKLVVRAWMPMIMAMPTIKAATVNAVRPFARRMLLAPSRPSPR